MKNSPPPLHSRYPPRKLLLFLLCNTHPAIGVMGNKNTTTLINNTDEVIEIRELRGIITGNNKVINPITVKAHQQTNIDPKEYDGDDSGGGQIPILMIFCGRSLLRSSKGDFLLPGNQFFSTWFKTVTIEQVKLTDQNSSEVVNYEVKFEPLDAYPSVKPLKFSRDPVLDHDNGWSVQCINGRVILTRKEGKPMTLDPSELFASNSAHDPETPLFCMALLMFWPGAFGKGDLEKTVSAVNVLMVQAKKYNVNQPESAVGEVMKNVVVLDKLCAAKVEWYRPLFPWMVEKIPPVLVDQEKLKKFETIIKPLLNSFPGRSSSKS